MRACVCVGMCVRVCVCALSTLWLVGVPVFRSHCQGRRLQTPKDVGVVQLGPDLVGLGLLGLDLLGSLAGSLAWLPYMCTVPARTHRRPEGEKDTTMPLANLGPAGLGVGQRQRGAPHLARRLVCVHCLSDMGFGCCGALSQQVYTVASLVFSK